jgi:hypothetical protein
MATGIAEYLGRTRNRDHNDGLGGCSESNGVSSG